MLSISDENSENSGNFSAREITEYESTCRIEERKKKGGKTCIHDIS